jgi:hypothetical protein
MLSKKENLTIISIPFYRLERILLNNSFFNLIAEKSDILIISDYKNRNDVKVTNCEVLNINNDRRYSYLYVFLEYMRVFGFFYKNRSKGLAYYNKEKYWEYGKNGKDKKKSKLNSWLIFITSRIGSNKFTRILFTFLFGNFLFSDKLFLEKVKNYTNVNIIQSANWDFQDIKLGWLSKKIKCSRFFLPYTTDQLMCNGFLVSDFDYILIQGRKEEFYAKTLHEIKNHKIIKFGSILFRNIDFILDNSININTKTSNHKILFVGVSTLYYPFESQLLIIDEILHVISKLPNWVLVLRPLLTEDEKNVFEDKYGSLTNVEIKYPEKSNYLLKPDNLNKSVLSEFSNHILNLNEVDICVFSGITSMILEASYLEKKIISVFDDPTGVLKRRNFHLFFKSKNELLNFNEFSELQIIDNINQIKYVIEQLIIVHNYDKCIYKKIVDNWDYPEVNQYEIINTLLFSNNR